MTHERAGQLLPLYSGSQANLPDELAKHVRACPGCEQEFAELKLVTSLLGRLPVAPLPRSFVINDLMLRRRKRRQLSGVVWLFRSLGAAAALMLLFALGADVRASVFDSTPGSAPKPSQVQAFGAPAALPANAPVTGESTREQTPDRTDHSAIPQTMVGSPAWRSAEAALVGLVAASGLGLWWQRRQPD